MRDRGTYALVIPLEVRLRLRVGGLGIHSLLPGHYVYVGSALGGLSGRLRHHLEPKKRLHWHIDYLLAEAEVTQIWYTLGTERLECTWNAVLGEVAGARSSVPGFGASDCRCRSHLTRFPTTPPLDLFAQRLRQMRLPEIHRIDKPTIGQPPPQ
ncbi:MAG: GIY-YIG nuclease family protein [Dehalococcoidia bacterium]|nr:GIY-YIG nuclease family protein [Dehalococcoidia bacterium]